MLQVYKLLHNKLKLRKKQKITIKLQQTYSKSNQYLVIFDIFIAMSNQINLYN